MLKHVWHLGASAILPCALPLSPLIVDCCYRCCCRCVVVVVCSWPPTTYTHHIWKNTRKGGWGVASLPTAHAAPWTSLCFYWWKKDMSIKRQQIRASRIRASIKRKNDGNRTEKTEIKGKSWGPRANGASSYRVRLIWLGGTGWVIRSQKWLYIVEKK